MKYMRIIKFNTYLYISDVFWHEISSSSLVCIMHLCSDSELYIRYICFNIYMYILDSYGSFYVCSRDSLNITLIDAWAMLSSAFACRRIWEATINVCKYLALRSEIYGRCLVNREAGAIIALIVINVTSRRHETVFSFSCMYVVMVFRKLLAFRR